MSDSGPERVSSLVRSMVIEPSTALAWVLSVRSMTSSPPRPKSGMALPGSSWSTGTL